MSLPDVIDVKLSSPSIPPRLIYFIPGNPGLIAYYIDFLNHLDKLLNQRKNGPTYHIHGKSLPGFQFQPQPAPGTDKPPYNLSEVIAKTKTSVLATAKTMQATQADANQPVEVILIGHSIGAYIALEVLNKLKREALKSNSTCNITATIALFPTIVDIALSPSGRKLSPFLTLPHFPYLLSLLAKLLTLLLPTPLLQQLVAKLTSFPPSAAATTTAFLQCPTGVRQALHMAADEMRVVREDGWGEEVWGPGDGVLAKEVAEVAEGKGARLFFYWGERDHWVSEGTRDGVIAARAGVGRGGGVAGPVMKIDRCGVPHSFCIRDSEIIAEEVAEWIGGME
ncbi:hypothetical protein MBLNU230_g2224t1 [Neophaeotheca triangularis]